MTDVRYTRATSVRIHAMRRFYERTGAFMDNALYWATLARVRAAGAVARDPCGRDVIPVIAPGGMEVYAVLDRDLDRIVTFLPGLEASVQQEIEPAETAMAAAFARAKQRSSPDGRR